MQQESISSLSLAYTPRMLQYADICNKPRMLTYADVCSKPRMLTYADVCSKSISSLSLAYNADLGSEVAA